MSIPLHLIAGALGVGKTTAIRQVVAASPQAIEQFFQCLGKWNPPKLKLFRTSFGNLFCDRKICSADADGVFVACCKGFQTSEE